MYLELFLSIKYNIFTVLADFELNFAYTKNNENVNVKIMNIFFRIIRKQVTFSLFLL
jgi:hypothetical protein